MKIIIRRQRWLLLGFIILGIFQFSTLSFAKTVKLPLGTWVTSKWPQKNENYCFGSSTKKLDLTKLDYYKVKANKDGYLEVHTKNFHDSYDVILFDKNKKPLSFANLVYDCDEKEWNYGGFGSGSPKNYCFLVKRGSYYIGIVNGVNENGKSEENYSICVKHKLGNFKNTSKKKAITIKKGKTKLLMSFYHHKSRSLTLWYKFKVNQKQRFKIRSNKNYMIDLVDTNGKRIDTYSKGFFLYSYKKLKKGTYYLIAYVGPGWRPEKNDTSFGELVYLTLY